VLAQKGAKRVALAMLRDLSAQQLTEAFDEGIKANHGAARSRRSSRASPKLLSLFTDAKKGDRDPARFPAGFGTAVTLNGVVKGKPIPGEDFYRALLRIWLGDKPVDGDLKKHAGAGALMAHHDFTTPVDEAAIRALRVNDT